MFTVKLTFLVLIFYLDLTDCLRFTVDHDYTTFYTDSCPSTDNMPSPLMQFKNKRLLVATKLCQLQFLLECKKLGVFPKCIDLVRAKKCVPKCVSKIFMSSRLQLLRGLIRNLRHEIQIVELAAYYLHLQITESLSNYQIILFQDQFFHNMDEVIQRTKNRLANKLRLLAARKGLDKTNRSAVPLINLSSYKFSPQEELLLAKGPNFAFENKISPSSFIPKIETMLQQIPTNDQEKTRAMFAFALQKHYNHLHCETKSESTEEIKLLRKLRHDSSIIFLQADKSRQLVVLDRFVFQSKIKSTLDDLDVSVIPTDPTAKLVSKTQNLIRLSKSLKPPPFSFAIPLFYQICF